MDEVEILACLFLGGDGCRVSRGDGRNKSERLERMGSSPSVEFDLGALSAGWELHGDSRDALRKPRHVPVSVSAMRSRSRTARMSLVPAKLLTCAQHGKSRASASL